MPAHGGQPSALGIDFGTAHTVAVLRRADGRTQPLLFDGSPLLPSAVYADADRPLLVGRDAVHAARRDPTRFEPYPKRRVDEPSTVLGDRTCQPVELVAAVLTRVADEAARVLGEPPDEVALACPAGWSPARRQLLSDAAARAGLLGPTLVEQPVAAAAYFATVLGRDVPVGSAVVVYHLGAGSFEASVVTRTATGCAVPATQHRPLGGLDLDRAVLAHLGERAAGQDPDGWRRLTDPSTVEDQRQARLLADDVCAAKERLSRQTSTDLVVPLLELDVALTRMELERLVRPLLEQTVAVTRDVLGLVDLAGTQPSGLLLVGGSSRIPLVTCLLTQALGEPPVAVEQPELVVAEGLLLVSPRHHAPRAWLAGAAVQPVPMPAAVTPPRGTRPPLVAASTGTPDRATLPLPAGSTLAAPTPAPTSPAVFPPVGPGQALPRFRPGAVPVPGTAAGGPVAAGPAGYPSYLPGRGEPALVASSRRPATVPPIRPVTRRTAVAQQSVAAIRGRSGVFRFVAAVVFLVLILAVPVVSAYVAYKLALGEPLLPISIDWHRLGLG